MFLKACPGYKGKIYLSFVQGYRDENGKVKQKTIEKIGYLDDLKKQYDDPISYFREIAKQKSKDDINELVIKNLKSKIIDDNSNSKNLGYVVLKKIYRELGITNILDIEQKKLKIKYNLDDILSMLVYMRVLKPSSKKNNFENMDTLFENYNFSLDDVYRSLTFLNPLKEKIQKIIWENTKDKYKRDTKCSFYDCTNYYFEVEYNDDDIFEYDKDGNLVLDKDGLPKIIEKGIRKRGPEKNHRPDPIVEMGLLMDKTGFPISYNIFSGSTSEKETLIPEVQKLKKRHNIDKVIIVADKGLNDSENMIKLAGLDLDKENRDGYIYSQTVRGADAEFKEWVLNESDYTIDIIKDDDGNDIVFKHKSRMFPRKMNIIRSDKGLTKGGNKRRQSIFVDQKQMVYYSQKYADKQKRDRQMAIDKAKALIKNPSGYTRATSVGAVNYINNIAFDKSTGAVADGLNLSLNEKRIQEEEKFDGFYAIVTSEENLSDLELRNIYKGLSKIEETFKITKSEFKARPINVRLEDHIDALFLICFIALVIIRILQAESNNKYSLKQLLEKIKNFECTHESGNIYKLIKYKPEIQYLNRKFNIPFDNKYLTREQIKKILKY